MGTIFDVQKSVNAMVAGFEDMVLTEMLSADLPDMVREQLYAGKNGRGKDLRPTYDNDPYFKTDEAGHWKNNADGYKRWKMKIQPPKTGSYLGISRNPETPNLIIRGNFYESIFAVKSDNGVSIGSEGFAESGDIERKYGQTIYGLMPESRRHLVIYRIHPAIRAYLKRYGLLHE